MVDDTIEAIRAEIFRLRADEGSVGPVDAIYVSDRGHGNAVIQASARAPRDLDWFGPAVDIFERLSGLPDDAGPEGIRSEFEGLD